MGRECEISSRPFYFRGCDLTAECLPRQVDERIRHSGCNSRQPHQFFTGRAPARAAESPKLSLLWGSTGGGLPFSFGVVADKQCTCLASKLMWERYPPTPPFQLRGNSTMYRAKPHKLASGGCDSHSRYQFSGKCSGCRSVNPVSENNVGSDELEHYQHFPPFLDP